MLGISFGEIMIIATIGLVVIGPKRLPETARFLGHLFGKIQRQVNSVKADIRREMALEDMKKIQREYDSAASEVKNVFDQAATGVSPPDDKPAGGDDDNDAGAKATAQAGNISDGVSDDNAGNADDVNTGEKKTAAAVNTE